MAGKTLFDKIWDAHVVDMSARGKRSGVAAERRPGLPIDEIPIALKGRNRRRLVLFGSVFFDRSRHSMAHCEVPHGSPARSDIDDLVGPRPCIRSGIYRVWFAVSAF